MSDSLAQDRILDILATVPAGDARPGPTEDPVQLWQEIQGIVRRQRVSALLHHRLQNRPAVRETVPDEIRREFQTAYQERTMRNLFLFSELQRMAKALNVRGIPVLVLKGVHLATEVYAEIGIREMDDIDLLVPREELQATVDIMRELGFDSREPIDVEQSSADVHHLPRMLNENNTIVEVHWNITWPKDRYSLSDLDGLWDRARTLKIADVEVLGLCPEDLLLHLCVHASYQHMFYTGLRPSCDIDATIRAYAEALDWDQVVERALQWEWNAGVYLMLRLTQMCLGTNVPASVLDALRPAEDESAVDAARYLLWNIESEVSDLPRNLARMWHRGSPLQKGMDIARAMLPSRSRVAKEYQLEPGSPLIWLRYPRYMSDLVQRHFRAYRQLQRSDPETRHMALSKSVLMDWLYEQ